MKRYLLWAILAVFLVAGPMGCGKKEIEELNAKEKEATDLRAELARQGAEKSKLQAERDKLKQELTALKKKKTTVKRR